MPEKCGSWPFCNQPPVPGGRFCDEHRVLLERVKAGMGSGRKFNAPPLPASVIVRYVEPASEAKRPAA
jgi:hypothetical protein